MSKRGADRDLTKDNADDEEEGSMEQQETGSWKEANETKLKQRVIVKVKRKMGDESATGAANTVSPIHSQPRSLRPCGPSVCHSQRSCG